MFAFQNVCDKERKQQYDKFSVNTSLNTAPTKINIYIA